ncbi:MAG: hypothetical protein IJ565_04510 [Bacilli bacterium]|nr:hypothetical protein [Bacilli bacterium]
MKEYKNEFSNTKDVKYLSDSLVEKYKKGHSSALSSFENGKELNYPGYGIGGMLYIDNIEILMQYNNEHFLRLVAPGNCSYIEKMDGLTDVAREVVWVPKTAESLDYIGRPQMFYNMIDKDFEPAPTLEWYFGDMAKREALLRKENKVNDVDIDDFVVFRTFDEPLGNKMEKIKELMLLQGKVR